MQEKVLGKIESVAFGRQLIFVDGCLKDWRILTEVL